MPTYVVEGYGHNFDEIEVTIEAEDELQADELALDALKEHYPEYEHVELTEVREIKDGVS